MSKKKTATPELVRPCRGRCGLDVHILDGVCDVCVAMASPRLRDTFRLTRSGGDVYARWAAEDAIRAELAGRAPASPPAELIAV